MIAVNFDTELFKTFIHLRVEPRRFFDRSDELGAADPDVNALLIRLVSFTILTAVLNYFADFSDLSLIINLRSIDLPRLLGRLDRLHWI